MKNIKTKIIRFIYRFMSTWHEVEILMIRSNRQVFFKIDILKNLTASQENACIGASF